MGKISKANRKQLLNKGRERYPRTYCIIRLIYRCIRPDIAWKRYKYKQFQEECYSKFDAGDDIIVKSYGEIVVKYKAISAKNYFALLITNQAEDRFMSRVFSEFVSKGDIVLDIGAHTGMYTMPFVKRVGINGKVYAFEPETKGFEAIKHSAILNSLDNIIPLQIAVSDIMGTVEFYVRPDKDTHSIFDKSSVGSPFGPEERVSVRTSSVDDMLESGIIAQPDFVKIDTEGAEIRILSGIKNASKKIKHILVEIHEEELRFNGIENPVENVEQNLKEIGFTKLEYLDDNHVMASR